MELRKDYLLNRWVIISEKRGSRPHQFSQQAESHDDPSKCFFCPGHEHETPPEISRYPDHGDWEIRLFPNKFPFAAEEGQYDIRTDNEFFTFAQPFGKHEVLVETNDHHRQLWDLEVDELANVFRMYGKRINDIYMEGKAKYVLVFKNHGRDAGTSIVHSHTQIVSLNMVPPVLKEKVDAVENHDGCPYCLIIEAESGSDRRCFENESFVAFTPYASRFNYEIWVFPKQHIESMASLDHTEIQHFAEIMKQILVKLKEIGCSFNYVVHNAPLDKDMHFHIEIMPRMAKWAGFELGGGVIINAISPETAAKFYRNELNDDS